MVRGYSGGLVGLKMSSLHSGGVFGTDVPVGVPVGCATANVNLQAGSAALGLTWGTLGAMGVV